MKYSDKLKDPRWQRKRLEILQRENFTCESCGDTTRTLHVHHGYYETGLDPWDYESSTLHCVCDTCHELQAARLRDIHYELAKCAFALYDEIMMDVSTARGFYASHPDQHRRCFEHA